MLQLKRALLTVFALLMSISSSGWARTMVDEKMVTVNDENGQLAGVLFYDYVKRSDYFRPRALAPRGSAALTGAGDMAQTGIRYVLHAATGSMGGPKGTEATMDTVLRSFASAIRLADKFGIRRIAVPLIGGGIFLHSLGVTREELAEKLIRTAQTMPSQVEIVFVGYTQQEADLFQDASDRIRGIAPGTVDTGSAAGGPGSRFGKFVGEILKGSIKPTESIKPRVETDPFFKRFSIVKGNIVNFEAHKAEAIVNAANTELMFGGGVAGVIGAATGTQQEAINQIGKDLIETLNRLDEAKKENESK